VAEFSKYHAPWIAAPLTLTVVAVVNAFESVILAEKYATIGIPTP
jgi:hypothetical protein